MVIFLAVCASSNSIYVFLGLNVYVGVRQSESFGHLACDVYLIYCATKWLDIRYCNIVIDVLWIVPIG